MDIQILLALQSFREAIGGALNDFFVQVSDLSYGIFIWMLAMVLFWGVDKRSGSYMFLNIGFSRFLMQTLKLTFCVYRPWIRSSEIVPVETASGYSFPSGHSVTAASNYGTVMERNRKNRPLCMFMGFLILLTMFSRLYIGVHTPQDVLVGALLGLAVVFFGAGFWQWVDEKPKRDAVIPCVGILLAAVFLLYITQKSYPMTYGADGKLLVDPAKMMRDGFKDASRLLGVCVAWFLERRFVRFSLDVGAGRRVTRCAVGALLLILYETAVLPAVTGAFASSWASFGMTFLELVLLIFLYPLCFHTLERRRDRKEA